MKINNIYSGDCLEILNKNIKKNSIDLIFADPPYNLENINQIPLQFKDREEGVSKIPKIEIIRTMRLKKEEKKEICLLHVN